MVVRGEVDFEVGEAAEEFGDEEVALVEAEVEEEGVGLLYLGEAAGGRDRREEVGLQAVAAVEMGEQGH